jgi:hypothetical protein
MADARGWQPATPRFRVEEVAVNIWWTVLALFLVAGCATMPSGEPRTPLALDLALLSGDWTGTIMSHEMGSAGGRLEAPARLTVADDGRFTLTSSGGTVVSGVALRTARGIVLEGRVTAGDPMTVGRAMFCTFAPGRVDAIYGGGESFYLGHRVGSQILLRRRA